MNLKENQRFVNGKVYGQTRETFSLLETSHKLSLLNLKELMSMDRALKDMDDYFTRYGAEKLLISYETYLGGSSFYVDAVDVKTALHVLHVIQEAKNKFCLLSR